MSIRVAINGFGRMGRLSLRAALQQTDPGLSFVHINEPAGDAACSAHLLEFDSVHGRWDAGIQAEDAALTVAGQRMTYSRSLNPAEVDWNGADIVLECSGKFKTQDKLAPYFAKGIRKIVVSAPMPETDALNIVYGVNHHLYDGHAIITAASCTTNCLAPLVKVIHEGLGIRHGSLTTIHDITNTQTIIDAPHKDLRRARALGLSLIPTSTGSAKAISAIFPELRGKLDGLAVRVPLLNASLTDCAFEVERATTVAEVNGLLQAAAEGSLAGILGYEERPLVSIDYVNDPRSSIVDAPCTRVINGTQVKILSWYDNEWGYACRMVDLARLVGRSLSA